MAFACCAGIEVVEARVPVASAEAAVAWDDLPASVVCPAVIRRKILLPIALSPRRSRSRGVLRTSGLVVSSFMLVHL